MMGPKSLLGEKKIMERKKHRLLFPPRYALGGPRNNERVRVVSSLNRMVRLYDKMLRRKNGLVVKGETDGA